MYNEDLGGGQLEAPIPVLHIRVASTEMLSVLLKLSRRWARSLWSVLLPSSRNLLLPMNASQRLQPFYPPDACVLSLTSCKKTSFIKTEPLGSAGASAAKEL